MKNSSTIEMQTTDAIFDHLDLLDIAKWPTNERVYVFNRNGSVGKVIKFHGTELASKSVKDIEEIIKGLKNFIDKINSEKTCVSFIQNRVKAKPSSIDLDHPKMTKEMVARTEMYNKLCEEGEILEDEFYIGINILPDHEDETIRDTFSRYWDFLKSKLNNETPKDYINRSFSGVNSRITKLDSTVNSLSETMIDVLGIECKVLEDESEIKGLYRSLIRSSKRGSSKTSKVSPIGKESLRQSLFAGIEIEKEQKDFFVMDGTLHRVYTLDRFNPEVNVELNSLRGIIEAPYEFTYVVSIGKIPNSKASSKFNLEYAKARAMESKTFGNADLIAEKNSRNILQAYSTWAESGESAVNLAIHFIYKEAYSKTKRSCKEMNLTEAEYLDIVDEKLHNNYFSKVGQSEWKPVDGAQHALFLKLLPGQTHYKNIYISTMIEIPFSCAHIIPLYTDSRDDLEHYGMNHFFSESNTKVNFRPLDPRLPSNVTLVAGDMGSGKSVNLQTFMASSEYVRLVTDKKPMLRVVDFAGTTGSFFKRARFLKKYGTTAHLEFYKAQKPCIQILKVHPEDRFPSDKKINEIKEVISLIREEINDDENRIAVNNFYNRIYDSEHIPSAADKDRFFYDAFKINPKDERLPENFVTSLSNLKEGECIPNAESMNTILDVFKIILSDEPADDYADFNAYTDHFDRDDIKELILETYNRNEDRFPYLRDVLKVFAVKYLEEDENGDKSFNFSAREKRFYDRLKNFTQQGQYPFFDSETDIDLNADFILFDLYGLEKYPKLFGIYSIFLLKLIDEDLHNNHDRFRAFYMDEAAMALTGGTGKQGSKRGAPIVSAIIKMGRTSRKHKYAVTLASQLPTDFVLPGTDKPNILISQARRHVFCGFADEKTIQETIQIYDIPKNKHETLRGLGIKTERRSKIYKKYSRFMVISKLKDNSRVINVFKNILSPFEYQNTSSSLEENAIIKFYTDLKGMDLEDVYEYINEKKHIGNQELISYLRSGNHEEALKTVDVPS